MKIDIAREYLEFRVMFYDAANILVTIIVVTRLVFTTFI